jgi:PDZ domain-containing protein
VAFPIVVTHRCTPLRATRDWLDGVDVRSREQVFGSASPQTADRINLELMGGSKHAAVAAALGFLGSRMDADRVRIDTGHVGGPSGGLAFTIALIDVLTPGELTGGHTVAVTGTIADDGAVGRVGGIRLKTLAARTAGVELFLVPEANYREAVANAGPMRVVPVRDLRSALDTLPRGS